MTVTVRSASRLEVELFIINGSIPHNDVASFFKCFDLTQQYWVGMYDDEVTCMWGLIPPSLASDQAYLWLYTTPALAGHEFVFVRHSQRAIEEMLTYYERIVGHCSVGAHRSTRWLMWLGAEFGKPENGLIPFTIRAKHG